MRFDPNGINLLDSQNRLATAFLKLGDAVIDGDAIGMKRTATDVETVINFGLVEGMASAEYIGCVWCAQDGCQGRRLGDG